MDFSQNELQLVFREWSQNGLAFELALTVGQEGTPHSQPWDLPEAHTEWTRLDAACQSPDKEASSQ